MDSNRCLERTWENGVNLPSVHLKTGVVLAALAACALIIWAPWDSPSGPIGVSVPAKVAKEVKKAVKVTIKPKQIKVFRPSLKMDLNLPSEVQHNEAIHVVAAAKVPADEHPHTLTTTINETTGEAQSFDRREPLPWLGRDVHGELGIYYGVKDGKPDGRLSIEQKLIQIKAVHLGAQATLDQDGTWFAGIGAAYRW